MERLRVWFRARHCRWVGVEDEERLKQLERELEPWALMGRQRNRTGWHGSTGGTKV